MLEADRADFLVLPFGRIILGTARSRGEAPMPYLCAPDNVDRQPPSRPRIAWRR